MANWILLTRYGSVLILILLIALSVWSVTIMVDRYRFFKKRNEGFDFAVFKKGLIETPTKELDSWLQKQSAFMPARALQAAWDSRSNSEAIDRSIRGFMTEERTQLEKGFTVLATLGSNAPFIGLFGTVLGIIEAFGQLSSSQSNTQAVIGGVSEALVATAIGLFVAIPAVVAYNVFTKMSKASLTECEIARDLFVSKVITHGR